MLLMFQMNINVMGISKENAIALFLLLLFSERYLCVWLVSFQNNLFTLKSHVKSQVVPGLLESHFSCCGFSVTQNIYNVTLQPHAEKDFE